MVQAGWTVYRSHQDQHATGELRAEVLDAEPHSGEGCLQLIADGQSSRIAGSIPSTPALWATTPAISVPGNHVIRIDGWVRMKPSSTGGQGKLVVFDSLGGPALGLPYNSGNSPWKSFTLVRATSGERPLTITFALLGEGEACIDDITVSPVMALSNLNPSVAAN